MLSKLKRLLFILTFNISLFFLLMLGIQNSTDKKKVNLIVGETVILPISFIVGISFIAGTLTGNILNESLNKNTQ